MLRADEFIVGTFDTAQPGSLILPRNEDEEAAVIGDLDGSPTAIVLSGEYRFRYMPAAGTTNWSGIIVPGTRFELDVASAFDPALGRGPLGSIIRTEARLAIYSKSERGGSKLVTLQSGLPAIADGMAGFSKWSVVIGEGQQARVLFKVDATPTKAE